MLEEVSKGEDATLELCRPVEEGDEEGRAVGHGAHHPARLCQPPEIKLFPLKLFSSSLIGRNLFLGKVRP